MKTGIFCLVPQKRVELFQQPPAPLPHPDDLRFSDPHWLLRVQHADAHDACDLERPSCAGRIPWMRGSKEQRINPQRTHIHDKLHVLHADPEPWRKEGEDDVPFPRNPPHVVSLHSRDACTSTARECVPHCRTAQKQNTREAASTADECALKGRAHNVAASHRRRSRIARRFCR